MARARAGTVYPHAAVARHAPALRALFRRRRAERVTVRRSDGSHAVVERQRKRERRFSDGHLAVLAWFVTAELALGASAVVAKHREVAELVQCHEKTAGTRVRDLVRWGLLSRLEDFRDVLPGELPLGVLLHAELAPVYQLAPWLRVWLSEPPGTPLPDVPRAELVALADAFLDGDCMPLPVADPSRAAEDLAEAMASPAPAGATEERRAPPASRRELDGKDCHPTGDHPPLPPRACPPGTQSRRPAGGPLAATRRPPAGCGSPDASGSGARPAIEVHASLSAAAEAPEGGGWRPGAGQLAARLYELVAGLERVAGERVAAEVARLDAQRRAAAAGELRELYERAEADPAARAAREAAAEARRRAALGLFDPPSASLARRRARREES